MNIDSRYIYPKPFMKHPFLKFFLPLCFLAGSVNGQNNTISGYITDGSTGEHIPGVVVWAPALQLGTTANAYGFYSLTLPAGKQIIQFNFMGYENQIAEVDLNQVKQLNIALQPANNMLNEVEVVAAELEQIQDQVQMSRMEVPIKQLKQLPAILGEVDIMKALQLLPGVQSGGEGTSGLYVRGGSPDQNLILLDGVPLYNVSHLFGFFSVFNADAISNVSLTKGGFPARFGGRLSSVLEVNMKEGNLKEFHGDGTVSIIASKLTLEGPLIKDKASFMISGRRTYLDLLARPAIARANAQFEGESVTPQYYFYDWNGKVNYKVGPKDRLYLSHFGGQDNFGIRSKYETDDFEEAANFGLDWQNSITAARWNHQWSNKLFSNVTATRSLYNFNTRAIYESTQDPGTSSASTEAFAGIYLSGIEDFGGKIDFDYAHSPLHYIKFGTGVIRHKFSPGATNLVFTVPGAEIDTTIGSSNLFSTEFTAYAEDEWKISEHLKANGGLHFAALDVQGASYSSLQPRFGMNLALPADLAFKASYAQMMQFVNLLSNEGIGLPTDLWVPSTANLAPQTSTQYAAGLAKTWKGFELSLEGYYKDMQNLVSYKEGANFLFSLDDDWQSKVTQGQGNSYGMEFFAQKKQGKTTGWLGYTLSWSWRQFDEINGGERYFFTYDRRHDISLVLNHDFSDRINFSGAWVYGTGRAITLPEFTYRTDLPTGLQFRDYWFNTVERPSGKNAFRMSNYHRLDLSLSFRKKLDAYERWWIFSAYNAYNNLNPFFIETATSPDGSIQLKEYGLFPIIPSVAYRIKF